MTKTKLAMCRKYRQKIAVYIFEIRTEFNLDNDLLTVTVFSPTTYDVHNECMSSMNDL